jgi:hypothetical protein
MKTRIYESRLSDLTLAEPGPRLDIKKGEIVRWTRDGEVRDFVVKDVDHDEDWQTVTLTFE